MASNDKNYAKMFIDAFSTPNNHEQVASIYNEWVENGQRDANFLYASVTLGILNPESDRQTVMGLYEQANNMSAVDESSREVMKRIADGAIAHSKIQR